MSKSVSDFIIDRIHDWGISRIFGYPGDGINGLMGARMSFTQATNFMSAIPQGDDNSWDMIKQTYKEVVDEYFPAS